MKSALNTAQLRAPSHPSDPWVPWPQGAGAVRSSWRDALAAAQLRTIDDFLTVQGEPLTKPGLGSRYRARLRITREGQARVVYLKRFAHDSLWARWRSRWEHHRSASPGERECNAAETLSASGLAVASALAWGVKKLEGGTSSFVILEEVPGLPSHHWAANLKSGRGGWSAKRAFAHLLGQRAAQFHHLGWRHRDFYLCHWFFDEGGQGLSLIDLQRVFRPRWRPTRWLIKDLAQLNFSATPDLFSRTMRLRFAHAYFGTTRLNGSQRQLIKHVLRKSNAIARREKRSCKG